MNIKTTFSSLHFIENFPIMKLVILFVLSFGFALGRQPSVWRDNDCSKYATYDNYVIKGVDAPDGKYPYMLSLQRKENRRHVCGASLLTKDWALTAAHCCAAMKNVPGYMYAGSNSLSKGGSDHELDHYVIHDKYKPSQNWVYDVCVVKVNKPFVFGPRVQQVTLPPQGFEVKDQDLVTITGWGYTDPYNHQVPDKLQLGGNFTAFSHERCKEATKFSHPSYLCALGGNGRGVCNGDSGSPLMKDGVQVGVASWVFTPCGCGLPDFYARVPHVVDWVKKTLGKDAEELKFMK